MQEFLINSGSNFVKIQVQRIPFVICSRSTVDETFTDSFDGQKTNEIGCSKQICTP